MKRKILPAIFFGLLVCYQSIAQENTIPVRDDVLGVPDVVITHHVDAGFGFGLDYGGLLGIQVGYAPVKHLTLFASGGYYMIQMGWQAGVKGLFLAKTNKNVARPFLKAMYGTHSIILVDGMDKYDKVYTGFTIGAGLELRFGKQKKNGFDFELNVPLRKPEYWQDYNEMKDDPLVEITQDQMSVAFSIGFHHEF